MMQTDGKTSSDNTMDDLEVVLGYRSTIESHTDYQDPLDAYLKEVGYKPLLTFEEEQALALLIQQNDVAAKNELIEKNLRLVIKIAKQYLYRGMPLSDLIEEGNLGLIHAASKFDPKKECRFSTYATWWIQEHIEKAIMNGGQTIRIPIHIVKAVNRLKSIYRRLSQKMDREPTVRDLAAEAHLPLQEVMRLLQVTKADHIEPLYFDTGEESSKVSDSSLYVHSVETYDAFDLNVHIFRDLMHMLQEDERDILIRRFGLHDGPIETLEQIADNRNLTRERVRQIQLRALKKLRAFMEDEGLNSDTIFDV